MSTSLTCQRCGGEMPPLPDELSAVLRSGQSVQLVHEVCPNEAPTAAVPAGRYFEVRTQIVEVKPNPDPAQDAIPGYGDGPEVVEMFEFRFGVRADRLDEAMRPLAVGLGEKWAEAEKHAGIADPVQLPAGDQS